MASKFWKPGLNQKSDNTGIALKDMLLFFEEKQ